MRSLIKIIKSINIRQVLTVFLAGSLLVISTACSQGNMAQAGGKAYTETAKRAMSDTYDDYDANQDFEGGMNGYNDDRRYNAETAAKTKALVDTAKSRQKDNLGDYAEDIVDRAGDKIEAAKEDIPRGIKETKDDAMRDIQARTDRLQDNLSKAPDAAKEVFDEATNTAQNAIKDAERAGKRTAKELKSNFEDLT